MPVTCIVMGCGSRGNRDKVSFYCVPGVVDSKYFPHLNDLSRRRRQKWITAIKRDDLTPAKLRNQRVCSRHFITGKPSKLEDVDHPDWAPSQHMGHFSQVTSKRKNDVDRKIRVAKIQKLAEYRKENEIPYPEVLDLEFENAKEQDTGFASQTDLTMEMLERKFQQLEFAAEKISKLELKIEKSPLGLMDDPANDNKWKYYTGFDYTRVQHIFQEIEPYIPTTSTTILSPLSQFLLVLVKLRLNLHFKDLAYRFKISPTTASTYFLNMKAFKSFHLVFCIKTMCQD